VLRRVSWESTQLIHCFGDVWSTRDREKEEGADERLIFCVLCRGQRTFSGLSRVVVVGIRPASIPYFLRSIFVLFRREFLTSVRRVRLELTLHPIHLVRVHRLLPPFLRTGMLSCTYLLTIYIMYMQFADRQCILLITWYTSALFI
jgi:hypothetical protein